MGSASNAEIIPPGSEIALSDEPALSGEERVERAIVEIRRRDANRFTRPIPLQGCNLTILDGVANGEDLREASVHDLVVRLGKEQAVAVADLIPDKRKRKTARELIMMAADILAEDSKKIGFTHSGFCLTSLPHSNPGDILDWERFGHQIKLHVASGKDKHGVPVGLPWGPKARVILLSLSTEAVVNRSPIVELGGSWRQWITKMGYSPGGSQTRQFREQNRRISACSLTFFYENEDFEMRHQGAFVETEIVFKDADPDQPSFWQDTVKLNPTYFDSLLKHPMPVSLTALHHLNSRSLAMDIYLWLSYRLHSLDGPTDISWTKLYQQFGSGYSTLFHFKPEFKTNLLLALNVYPEARVSLSKRGLTLWPSPSPVSDVKQLR